MKEIRSPKNRNKKVEELHRESQGWKSNLYFMKDEMTFIHRLLTSYVFEPNTPNLFERLQDYQHRLKRVKTNQTNVEKSISRHENDLGGMLECTDESCDLEYYGKHDKIKAKVVDCTESFRELKSEIFNYAGGILKKRKPTF